MGNDHNQLPESNVGMRRASQTADVIRVGSIQLYHLNQFWLDTIEKNVTAITGAGFYFQNSLRRWISWKIGKGREGYVDSDYLSNDISFTFSIFPMCRGPPRPRPGNRAASQENPSIKLLQGMLDTRNYKSRIYTPLEGRRYFHFHFVCLWSGTLVHALNGHDRSFCGTH